jgi:hypothetical protein
VACRGFPQLVPVGCSHFGSLERVFAARCEELMEVRGIGPVRADAGPSRPADRAERDRQRRPLTRSVTASLRFVVAGGQDR